MTAETLLRLTEFELRTCGDSNDLQDVQYNISRRMEAIGMKPMTLEEADNAKFAIRELRARKARIAEYLRNQSALVALKGGAL